MDIPKRNDDKLGVLGAVLDVIGDDGNIPEIERCVNLVHEVKRSRLHHAASECLYRGQGWTLLTLKTCRAKTSANELKVWW